MTTAGELWLRFSCLQLPRLFHGGHCFISSKILRSCPNPSLKKNSPAEIGRLHANSKDDRQRNHHHLLVHLRCRLAGQRRSNQADGGKPECGIGTGASDSSRTRLVVAHRAEMVMAFELANPPALSDFSSHRRGHLHLRIDFHALGAAHTCRKLEQRCHFQAEP